VNGTVSSDDHDSDGRPQPEAVEPKGIKDWYEVRTTTFPFGLEHGSPANSMAEVRPKRTVVVA
jgi:hypothetical protein